MSIWGKIAGVAAGFAFGGPIGALVGGVAGHFAVDHEKTGDGEGKSQSDQVAFTVGVIALGAKMAKADGVVTADEVIAFKEVFKVPEGEMKNVARVFDLAKQDVAGYEAYADQLAKIFRNNKDLLRDVLEGLFHIAKADGIIHPNEEDFLIEVSRRFGFSETEFKYTMARHIQTSERCPYDVLEVSREISDADLKKHYRKLVMENHPDKLVSRGVPEEFVKLATDKLAAINEAYDEIAKERGL
ncbi:MAG: TerB family tellurite resistance protein [Methyloligellaceae bacterium]